MRLDAKSVAALKLDGKTDAIHFDDTLPGFGYRLRRSHDGSRVLRSWIVQYKRAGASRRILLGSAEVLGADPARVAAKKLLAKVALGEDPQADRRDRREKDKLSLRSQVEVYLAFKKGEVRAKTLTEITRYLTGPYLKPLHSVALDMIGRKDVASRLLATQHERGNIVAKKVRDMLSAFYVWAMEQGLVAANPVVGTTKLKNGKPSDRVLDNDELVAIWNACGDDDYGKIIRLLICTGCRRQEIGGIAWSEFDNPDNPTAWTLRAERSKNGRAHTLPLMLMVLDIIRSVPRMVSRDQLFGSRSGAGFRSWDKGKTALDARSGVSNWTPHDIRRTVATKMADLGVQPHIIEQILNHQSGHKAGPAGIYNKSSYEREVRNALAKWEDQVRTLVEGGERKVIHIGAPHAPQAVP
jgi:integrase